MKKLFAIPALMLMLGGMLGTAAAVTEPPAPAAAYQIGCIIPPSYANASFGCGKVLSEWGSGANIRIQSKDSDLYLRVSVKSGNTWRDGAIVHAKTYSGVYTVNGYNGQTIQGIRILRCVIGSGCTGGYRTIYWG